MQVNANIDGDTKNITATPAINSGDIDRINVNNDTSDFIINNNNDGIDNEDNKDDDEACLLAHQPSTISTTSNTTNVSCSGPKCRFGFQIFWAELVAFMYAFCDFPINLVTPKYTLEWLTQYNWDQDILNNVTHNFSIFDNNSDVSPCQMNSSTPGYAFNQRNQSMASYFSILRMLVWVGPAILSNLVLGSASDKLGRKWVFIPPVLGGFIFSVVLIFITLFKLSILWLLIIDFLVGFSGTFGCLLLASVAFVIEQTTSSNRLFRLAILQLFYLLGGAVSPFAMGPLLTLVGAPMTMLVPTFVSFLNLLYCILFIPKRKEANTSGIVVVEDDESLISDVIPYSSNNRPTTDSMRNNMSIDGSQNGNGYNANIESPSPNDNYDAELIQNVTSESASVFSMMTDYVRDTFSIYSSKKRKPFAKIIENNVPINSQNCDLTINERNDQNESSDNSCKLKVLLLAFFILIIPALDGVIMTLFELNSPLCWLPYTIGIYTGVSISVTALGSLILTPLFQRFCSHITVAIISCIACGVSRIYIFFVKNTLMMFLVAPLAIINVLVFPSVRTMMTLLVHQSRHGAVLGSMEAVEILCCLIAGILFNVVYSATLMISTSAVFLVSGGLFLLGAAILIAYRIKFGTGENEPMDDTQEIPTEA